MRSESAVTEREMPRGEVRDREAQRPRAGLCTTCSRVADCTYRRDVVSAVLMCEEFEGALGPLGVPGLRSVGDARPAVRNPVPGLCSTCEAFRQCTLPRGDGGVWRCEEFR